MLFGPRSRPLIGLDITTSSIKLVELTQAGRSFRAESYAEAKGWTVREAYGHLPELYRRSAMLQPW